MNYPVLIFFGLAPSVIWLLFFLRKDKQPESNRMVLKIFFYGMLVTVPAALIELGFAQLVAYFRLPVPLFHVINAFLGIALIEEMAKYLIVKKKVISNAEFDEPVDVMLYMIIAALGFAALENILIFLPLGQGIRPFFFEVVIATFILRLVGATFLHALVSALIGYFMAFAFCYPEKRFRFTSAGMILAVALHGLYDFSIISVEGGQKFIIPVIMLVLLAIFISFGFKKVKALKSVCNPKKT